MTVVFEHTDKDNETVLLYDRESVQPAGIVATVGTFDNDGGILVYLDESAARELAAHLITLANKAENERIEAAEKAKPKADQLVKANLDVLKSVEWVGSTVGRELARRGLAIVKAETLDMPAWERELLAPSR